jgi:putative restriction endonuclease
MDLIAEGTLTSNLVEPTPDLGELFSLYWSRVMPADRLGNLAYPFFHLRSGDFWHLVARPGREQVLQATKTVSSVPQLKTLVLGARLDDELTRRGRQGAGLPGRADRTSEGTFMPSVWDVRLVW